MDESLASYHPFIRNCKWYWLLFFVVLKYNSSLYNSWLVYKILEENVNFLVTQERLQCHICKCTSMQKNHSISGDSFPCFSFHWKTVSGKLPFSRDSFSVVIQNELRNELDLIGWIILSVLMRNQDVHSVGKQWNINAPSVTINYMIIVFHFFMT